ncbi:hypothetical protein BDR07DRAFT_1481065 [Suillus spraguei]|nr:hypothetical protein BDR07DRAFT_1481065 [Suillus spraguei]
MSQSSASSSNASSFVNSFPVIFPETSEQTQLRWESIIFNSRHALQLDNHILCTNDIVLEELILIMRMVELLVTPATITDVATSTQYIQKTIMQAVIQLLAAKDFTSISLNLDQELNSPYRPPVAFILSPLHSPITTEPDLDNHHTPSTFHELIPAPPAYSQRMLSSSFAHCRCHIVRTIMSMGIDPLMILDRHQFPFPDQTDWQYTLELAQHDAFALTTQQHYADVYYHQCYQHGHKLRHCSWYFCCVCRKLAPGHLTDVCWTLDGQTLLRKKPGDVGYYANLKTLEEAVIYHAFQSRSDSIHRHLDTQFIHPVHHSNPYPSISNPYPYPTQSIHPVSSTHLI